ncbi:DUF1905 domain-containing protein [Allomeiothermus silvanus]|uniref:DUF1905 domain-containing protein n=1 Tax=Allomeiothermus silvanus TaxID=52022 RepID=UPI0023F3D6F2|nr:DUF1905 domain-containing protein [Allomeiothermus silvanus]
MSLEFSGEVWQWRGPAPFYFVTVPAEQSRAIKDVAKLVTYGWGVIPVRVRIGKTEWKTSLFPKDGLYLVPLKDVVRKAEGLAEGDRVTVWLEIGAGQKRKP